MVLPYSEFFVYKVHKTFNALIMGINQKRLDCFVCQTTYLIIATALLPNRQQFQYIGHIVFNVMS